MTGKSKVLAYRLDEEKENDLRDAVNSTNLELFAELLDDVEANYKSINVIKKILKKLEMYKQEEWGKQLVEYDQATHIVLGSYLLERNEVFLKEPDYVLDLIKEFCGHEDWNVRQSAVDLLTKMVTKSEDHQLDFLETLVQSDKPHYRRLALLTSKAIAKSAKYDDELKRDLLEVIEDLLGEEDPYVQTVSSDTFNEGFMKYCTEMTLDWLSNKIDETDDPIIKSTALSIVGSRHLDDYLEKALEIIDKLLEEDDDNIKMARSSTLHTLAEAHHDRVCSYLEGRLHIKQAVDHWAELEADGSINSFTI